MKTTIDIADNIMRQAKALARREHVTFRELVEEGLERVVADHAKATERAVTPVTFRGRGLSREYQGASWTKLRDAAYEGRGS